MSNKSPIFPISDPLHFNDAQTDYFHQVLPSLLLPLALHFFFLKKNSGVLLAGFYLSFALSTCMCEGLGGSEEAAPAGNEVRRRAPLQAAETHLKGGVQEEQEEEMVAECAAVSQLEPGPKPIFGFPGEPTSG